MVSLATESILDDFAKFRMKVEVADLVSSFDLNGQLSPLMVRPHPIAPNKFQLIFGHRRFLAAKELGWKTIDATIVDTSDLNAIIVAFVENVDRMDFADYEKGLVLRQISAMTHKSHAEVATMIGKSASFVSQHMSMIELFSDFSASQEEKVKVICSLSERHARELARIKDPEERWNTAKMCIASRLGVRELERMVNSQQKNVDRRRTHSSSYLQSTINKIISGFNSGDLRPYFSSMSKNHFSMFSQFPPYDRLDAIRAERHMIDILRQVESLDEELEEIDLRIRGEFAYVTMILRHRILMNGKKVVTRTRGTLIFEKNRQWEIVHHHWSSADPGALVKIFDVKSNNALI